MTTSNIFIISQIVNENEKRSNSPDILTELLFVMIKTENNHGIIITNNISKIFLNINIFLNSIINFTFNHPCIKFAKNLQNKSFLFLNFVILTAPKHYLALFRELLIYFQQF